MNAEELLRYAAKAAGFVEPHSYRPRTNCLLWVGKESGAATWRPLDDDAEAFRLAVKLRICYGPNLQGDLAVAFHDDGPSMTEPYEPDPYAATRRAIVMAAAEIGKQQEKNNGN